jgi:HPt (histidine-containing phosphotransfer) domain-containing protein
MDDPALEIELLEMFDRQSARLVSQLMELGPADVAARADLAHRLRGSALALGATRVAAAAQALEDCRVAGPDGERLIQLLARAVSEARAEIGGLTQ